MKKVRQSWRPSPALVAITTSIGLLALMIFLNALSPSSNRFNVQVEIGDPLIETIAAQSTQRQPSLPLPDGEVERTAIRVREVTALVMGLTLFAVNEAIARRSPTNVEMLLDRFAERGLFPPEIRKHPSMGVVESGHAVIYVRYRIEPLAIEIVSLGRERQDGPAMIGRIATGEDQNAGPSLFIARQTSNATIPEPFAPATQIAAMNWSVEPFRERSFSPQELEQINGWLRTQDIGK